MSQGCNIYLQRSNYLPHLISLDCFRIPVRLVTFG